MKAMKERIVTLLIVCLSLALISPGGVLAQNQAAAKPAEAPADTAAVTEDPLDFRREVLDYKSRGRRDPFESLAPKDDSAEGKVKGLFNYEKATLKGVISTEGDRYALVADADGLGYVLRKGYRIFGGYVTDITDESVSFHIVKYGRSMTIIMRLASSRMTVYEERDAGDSIIQKPGITIQYRTQEGSGDEPDVTVDDVVLPSLDTKTVEELWFPAQSGASAFEDNSGGKETESAPIAAFTLFDPPDGTVISLPYAFNWTSLAGNGIIYTLIVDDSPDFSSPLLVRDGIVGSSCVIGEGETLPVNMNLYWKVTAKDAAGAGYVSRRTDMSFRIR